MPDAVHRRSRRAVGVVALAIVCCLAAFAPATATHSGPEYHSAKPLHDGWNFIAWPNPEAAVGDVRADFPAVLEVRSFSVAVQQPAALDGDKVLRPGDLLWLRVSVPDDSPVSLPVTSDLKSRRVRIAPGLNIVPWLGRDHVKLSNLMETVADSLPHVAIWDPSDQQWRLSRSTDADQIIRTGDVLLTHNARDEFQWQQPSGILGNLEFAPSISQAQRDALLAQTATIETLLADDFKFYPSRYGISVASTWRELAILTSDLHLADLPEEGCPSLSGLYLLVSHSCISSDFPLGAPEQLVVAALNASFPRLYDPAISWGFSTWLTLHLVRDNTTRANRHASYIQQSRDAAGEIDRLIGDIRWDDIVYPPVWYLWTDWLIRTFGGPALFDLLNDLNHFTKAESYLRAFGQTEEQLYRDFAAYRAVVAPPLNMSGDRLLISGAEALKDEQQIRQIIAQVEHFFAAEFKFSAEEENTTWQVTSLTGSSYSDCGAITALTVFIGPSCLLAPSVYAHEFFHHMQGVWGDRVGVGGPAWEGEGQATYWQALFDVSSGATEYRRWRSGWVQLATGDATPALDDPELVNADGSPEYWLGALAAEMLASIADRHAIRDWYGGMVAAYRETQDYEQAQQRGFYEAYGISMDEFYRRFAEWRADGFPQLPEAGSTP